MFLMLDEYEKAWKDAHPLSFTLARFESCPPFVPIAAPKDPVLVTTFTVAFGYGTPMTGAGWVANAQAGPICGFEGVGTLWLNAWTLPAQLAPGSPGSSSVGRSMCQQR